MTKIKELEQFKNVQSIEEFEQEYNKSFKRKFNKCKKNVYIDKFSIKLIDNSHYKLCNDCRNIMRQIMRGKNKKISESSINTNNNNE